MNKATFQGKIVNIYNVGGITKVTLFTRNNGTDAHSNFPEVSFYGRELGDKISAFAVGDFVTITGEVKVRRAIKDGHPYFIQFIRGNKIDKAQTDMAAKFGEPSLGGRHGYKNEILISGTVAGSYVRHGYPYLLVKPTNEKFNIAIVNFDPRGENFIKDYGKDREACFKCEIQTSKKIDKEGNTKYYSDLVSRYSDLI